MPGIVVFGRRWSVGSDDLVVAAVLLLVLHIAWTVALGVILGVADFDSDRECVQQLREEVLGYTVLLGGCLLIEGTVAWISMRGNILLTDPRASMQYLLYIRLVIFLGEVAWMIRGIIWMVHHFTSYDCGPESARKAILECLSKKIIWMVHHFTSYNCGPESARKALLGLIVTSCLVLFIVIISLWCTFDTAGRKWVKMKRYQESLKEKKRPGKRSGSTRRNWRQRKAFKAYEESWDRRLNILCCCIQRKGRNQNSIAEVARLFTDFFRDLDVVPSDVIAGLVLLRSHQKLRMKYTVAHGSNDVYEYLSGVPITPHSQFLSLRQPDELEMYKRVLHYMSFAMAAYGWPAFLMANTGTGLCRIMPHLRCCCCLSLCGRKNPKHSVLIDDNCCHCNFAALNKLSGLADQDIVYVTYHVDVGETPYFVSLDHQHKKVVISIRGTLSLQDIITDLKAEPEPLPVKPLREDWYGHQGMVQAAVYIQNQLKERNLLADAFTRDPSKGTPDYGLVLVGHSLGAGTAAILAILLRQEYPNLECYAFSPPGGLLSPNCVEETKHYITSVVVGKDVVPRIGLHQMECLRTDLINVIKQSTHPKWKIIAAKLLCCRAEEVGKNMDLYEMKMEMEKMDRDVTAHPLDSAIGLTAHNPLFPPGKIMHVVRSHPKSKRGVCGNEEPVYQAIWIDKSDFDEVLISPTMINDHMPDNVLEALQKVLINVGPAKPTRILSEAERKELLEQPSPISSACSSQKLYMETSFTNLNPAGDSPTHQLPDPEIGNPGEIGNSGEGHSPQPGHIQCVTWNDIALESERNFPRFIALGAHPYGIPPERDSPNFILHLNKNWDVGHEGPVPAPLASPEALSETSSIASVSRSCSLRDSQYRLTNEFPRMDKIVQSPSELNAAVAADVSAQTIKPKTISLQEKHMGVKFREKPANNTVTTEAAVEKVKRRNGNAIHINPANIHKQNRAQNGGSSAPRPTKLLETSLTDDDICESTELLLDSLVVQENDTLTGTEDMCPMTNGSHDHLRQASPSGYYQRHSPVECTQHEYAQYLGHYSPAGRGYPHGAYHPPFRQFSPSECRKKTVGFSKPSSQLPEPSDLSAEVFDGKTTMECMESPMRRVRLQSAHSTPMPSNQTNSPDEELDKRLSCHSDEVFEYPLPLQQTDV